METRAIIDRGNVRRRGFAMIWVFLVVACGCSGAEEHAARPTQEPPAPRAVSAIKPRNDRTAPSSAAAAASADRPPPVREWRSSLADLLKQAEAENHGQPGEPFGPMPFPEIDENRLSVAGIRKVEGAHLTLFTDLPAQPAIDELPRVFDLAVPQWCAYFGIDPAEARAWRMYAYLMGRKESFAATGLLPDDLPPFLHGFQRGYELWLYEQPSDYYRRHLLLHEGTHGFMRAIVGGGGPPWYLEGTAELLGTHRWQDGVLTLNYFPPSKNDAPMWGRIKLVQDAFAASRGLTLAKVFALGPQAHLEVEPYGWSWAAAAFLDGNPRTQPAFRALRQHVRLGEPEFSAKLRAALGDSWPAVVEEWQLFVARMEYGYDLAREAVAHRPGVSPPPEGQTVTVAADRGWQSSGVLVEEGRTYEISAAGRYTVAQTPQPWWCEPNGVTLRYYRGLPLGVLLGTVRREDFAEEHVSALLNPGPLGTGRTIRAPTTGVLYFRINDSPAELADNAGSLTVHIQPTS